MEQTVTSTMIADGKALAGVDVDVEPLLGTWVNARRDTDHVTSVVMTSRDGSLFTRLCGAGESPVDWGEVPAHPYAFTGSREVAGFHARYSLGAALIEIAANVKLGILVIQTYTQFQDERVSQFSREFFYRSDAQPGGSLYRSGASFLLGDWVNTYASTRLITGFSLSSSGEGMVLRVQAANEPADWGSTEAVPYLDGAGDPAFYARYDLEDFEAVLACNTGKSIIIVEAFLRMRSGESANTFCREFFVPR